MLMRRLKSYLITFMLVLVGSYAQSLTRDISEGLGIIFLIPGIAAMIRLVITELSGLSSPLNSLSQKEITNVRKRAKTMLDDAEFHKMVSELSEVAINRLARSYRMERNTLLKKLKEDPLLVKDEALRRLLLKQALPKDPLSREEFLSYLISIISKI